MYTSSILAFGLQALSASAAIVTVNINGRSFGPDSVTAAVGDQVEFIFGSGHNVVQGDFNNACQPAASNPSYSGVINRNGDAFRINITNTDPIFYYCSVGNHCRDGMSGAINPSSSQTIAAYKERSRGASGASAPSAVAGGEVIQSAGIRSAGVAMGSLIAAGVGAVVLL